MNEELLPEDEFEVAAVSRVLRRTPSMSAATADVLTSHCGEVPLSSALSRRLDALGRAAEADLEYQASIVGTRRPASLGGYLLFLRTRLGLDPRAAATKARVPVQLVGDLERDGLSPVLLPAAGLIRLLKSLGASLEMTEQLLGTLVRAPALVPAPASGRLFRSGGGSRPTSRSQQRSSAASRLARGEPEAWIDNPDHQAEREAVAKLGQAIRNGW